MVYKYFVEERVYDDLDGAIDRIFELNDFVSYKIEEMYQCYAKDYYIMDFSDEFLYNFATRNPTHTNAVHYVVLNRDGLNNNKTKCDKRRPDNKKDSILSKLMNYFCCCFDYNPYPLNGRNYSPYSYGGTDLLPTMLILTN